jgi:uncharacterized membrane protein YfcA
LEPLELSVLCAAALATSILSAIVGMAGGLTLLSVMLLFLEPLAAIPVHGVVQLVSNTSRTLIQRRYVDWKILSRYGLLLLPMGFVGLHLARSLPPAGLGFLIGVFVLLATWTPRALLLGTHPEQTDPSRRFLVLGGVIGVLNMTLGATGPLIAPFFLNIGLPRQGVIGTKAACQALGHLVKIAIFGVAGFAYRDYLFPLALLCAVVVAGSWIGSRLLERVNELWFRRLYMAVLTAIAARLVIGEGLSALGAL